MRTIFYACPKTAELLKADDMLSLYQSVEQSKVIIFCEGRIVRGEEEALLKAISLIRRCDHLTLDLAGVRSVDASGLGVFAAVARWALEEQVEFVISNPNRRVYELIHIVNLDRVIHVRVAGLASSPHRLERECAAGLD
jgi:anti-anti-sigma factor